MLLVSAQRLSLTVIALRLINECRAWNTTSHQSSIMCRNQRVFDRQAILESFSASLMELLLLDKLPELLGDVVYRK